MKDSISIAFVIPSFNRKLLLTGLLNQLALIAKEPAFQISIIVVNDGSSDGTEECLQNQYPEITQVLGTGDWWYTKSINEGIKAAMEYNPKFIMALNDDMKIPETFAKKLSEIIPSIENTMVKCAEKDIESGSYTYLGEYIDLKYHLGSKYYVDYPDEVINKKFIEMNCGHGRGLLFPSKLIYEAGLFDERFKQYYSDMDFTLQAAKKGYRIVLYPDFFIYDHTELTGSTRYEKKPSLKSFVKRLITPTSPSYLPAVVLFNYKNAQKGYFLIRCTLNCSKVIGGYLKRYLKSRLSPGK